MWLHGVSVGEVVSAVPILEELRRLWPGMRVHLTSTIEDALVVAGRTGFAFESMRFLPLDLPWTMDRVVDRIGPDVVLISETDFWPNMLHVLARRRVPTVLVNGRISYKIAGLYRSVRPFSVRMFGALARAFVQTGLDASRLASLGYPGDRAVVMGNTKYEAALRPLAQAPCDRLVERLAASPLSKVVGGSTHPGEEELLLDGLQGRSLLLVLAPRDVRRTDQLVKLAGERRWPATTFSRLEQGLPEPGVVVVDELGVLPRLYGAATAAFVWGTFDGSGGHNFLEAARFGVPVVVGPATRNFHGDVAAFLSERAIVQVAGPGDVSSALARLLDDPADARAVGERGRTILTRNQGAARRTAQEIATLVGASR
ncbi:MAG: hypothetical protein HY815_29620 [Candidatus Riflebacteria bacterium]|nr:hypothetical protein [Candidatus Riflebacteria bacterium]